MKKLLFISLAALVALTGCKKEPAPDLKPRLSTTAPKAIRFNGDGSKAFDGDKEITPTFTVKTNQDQWSTVVVTPDEAAEWCTVTPATGSTGDTFTVSAKLNTGLTAPTATITVTAGDAAPVTIAVTQDVVDDVYAFVTDAVFLAYLKGKSWDGGDGKLSRAEAAAVTEIDVSNPYDYTGTKIESLAGIGFFTGLTSLNCNHNSLTTLDVSNFAALTSLVCYANSLTSLDVSGCAALTSLVCYANSLTELSISDCTALTALDCAGNLLMELNVSGCTELTSLNCSRNSLIELDLSANTALTRLVCHTTLLTTLDVSANTALTELVCSRNSLETLDVSANTALTKLDCGGCLLTTLDVSQNTALVQLECFSNRLMALDASTMAEPTNYTLYCGGQTSDGTEPRELMLLLSDAQEACWNTLPESMNTGVTLAPEGVYSVVTDAAFLAYLKQKTWDGGDGILSFAEAAAVTAIDVSEMNIKSLAGIEFFTGLASLNCGNNQLTALDVSNITALTSLYCYNNRLATLDASTMAEPASYNLYCGLQTSNGTAPQTLTLTLSSEQGPRWEALKSEYHNGSGTGITVTYK